MPAPCAAGEAKAAEGREWWVQLQRERQELGLRRKSSRADSPLPGPEPQRWTTPEGLLSALHVDFSPELAADLGLPRMAQPDEAAAAAAVAGAAPLAAPSAADAVATQQDSEEEAADGEGEGTCLRQPAPARHATLVKASQVLLHRMAQHKHLELDAMSQLAAADAAAAAAAAAAEAGPRSINRSNSDMRHLADVLQNGSDLMARAAQASSAWQGLRRPAAASALGPQPAGTLSPISEGGRQPTSPRRPAQRKPSILGQPSSLASSSSSASLGGGPGGGGCQRKRVSLALPSAAGAAERRWEEEQEAELAEVFRVGAFGDPEIQEYLIKELSRSGGRRTTGGRGGGGGDKGDDEEGDNDRLDPIVQAWLVTKVPAPRVEGYAPPPSRTACRLIAAQEMQKYYLHQKRRAGSYFRWLGLTQEQAGQREPTGKFQVGSEEKVADAPRKSFRGLVRKSVVASTLNDMVKGAQATVWAREHAEQVLEEAARGLARQRAIRAWQGAFEKVKALPPGAAHAWGPLEEEPAPPLDAAAGEEGQAPLVVLEGPAQGGAPQATAPGPSGQQGRRNAAQQGQPAASMPAGQEAARPSAAGGWSRSPSQLGASKLAPAQASTAAKEMEASKPSLRTRSGSTAGGSVGSVSGAPGEGWAPRGGSRAGSLMGAAQPGASIAGDRRSTAVEGGGSKVCGASRLSQAQGGAAGEGLDSSGGGTLLTDVASVAVAAVAEQRRRGGRGRGPKLPPLHLEQLQKNWQAAAAFRQNTERARQEARAREGLRGRWEQLQQRRAAGA